MKTELTISFAITTIFLLLILLLPSLTNACDVVYEQNAMSPFETGKIIIRADPARYPSPKSSVYAPLKTTSYGDCGSIVTYAKKSVLYPATTGLVILFLLGISAIYRKRRNQNH